jgi:hypothetical protein
VKTVSQVGIILLLLVDLGSSLASGSRLERFPDPDAIANGLSKLEQSDWQGLSSAEVRAIWPTGLTNVACESERGCRIFGSSGRIIEGHCECCETFDFAVKHDAADGDELQNIIIHYSAREREEVVGVARKLAKAVGLPDSKLAEVGKSKSQRFHWESSQGSATDRDLELQFGRVGKVWQAEFAFAHQ